MAAAANVTLKNRLAVDVPYLPRLIKTGEEAMWRDETSGVEKLQPRATLYYRENPDTRTVSVKCTYPVLDAITGQVDEALFKGEFRLPRKFSLNDRQEIRTRAALFVSNAVVQSAVDSGETPW